MRESKRQLKFSKLIQKELSGIFQKDLSGAFKNALVTIVAVKVSPDLGIAKIYLSIFGTQDSNNVIEVIEENKGRIRGTLGKRIGKEVRVIPELVFFDDKTAEEASHIDRILDNLVIPPDTEDPID